MLAANVARLIRMSELMLLLRSSRGSHNGTEPVCQVHAPQDCSPTIRNWGPRDLVKLGASLAFNTTHAAWQYRGKLRVECLVRAAVEVIRRHSILRSMVHRSRDEWCFAAEQSFGPEISHLEVASSSSDADDEAMELLASAIWRPFRVDSEAPMRLVIVKIAEEHYFLGFVIHHFFADAYSTRICSYELAMFYEAYSTDQPVACTELPLQYVDYMASMEEWSRGLNFDTFVSYWSEYLQGARGLSFVSGAAEKAGVVLSRSLSDSVRSLGRSERIGANAVWDAAYQVALWLLSGQSDITILTATVGRKHKELVNLIGQFSGVLPLRGRISGSQTFRTFLRQMRRAQLESLPYTSVPWHLMADRCGGHLRGGVPTINFVPEEFLPIDSFGPILEVPAPRYSPDYSGQSFLVMVHDRLQFEVVCSGNIVQPFSIAQFPRVLEQVVVELTQNPDGDLSLLPAACGSTVFKESE